MDAAEATTSTSAPTAAEGTSNATSQPASTPAPVAGGASGGSGAPGAGVGASGGDAAPDAPGGVSSTSTGAPPSATSGAPATPRTYRVKVGGTEREVSESELLSGYRLREASEARFREAAEARRAAEERDAALRDPQRVWEALRALGHDPRALSEQHLAAAIRAELQSPQERALAEAQARIAEQERQLAAVEEERAAKEHERATAEAAASLERDIVGAIQAAPAQLHRSPGLVREVAYKMLQADAHGYALTAGEAVEEVRLEQQALFLAHVSGLDGAALLALLGEERAKLLRAADVARLTGQPVTPPVAPAAQSPAATERARDAKGRYLSRDEWRARLDSDD